MRQRLFFLLSLLAIAWLALLPACKKDTPRTTHLNGRVTEYGTGIPLAGARIYILCDDGTIFGPSGSSLADSLVTDADGRFDRTYAEDALCGSFYLLPYKEGYFVGSEVDVTTEFKELGIELYPEGWIKIRGVPDHGNDQAEFQIGNFSRYFLRWWGDTTFFYTAPLIGNKEYRIYTSTYPAQDTLYEMVYIPAHDTTTYTIHY